VSGSTLYAYIGSGSLTLKDASGQTVRRLAVGTYTIVVRDSSSSDNFHLQGPGVNKSTSVSGTGEYTWTVTFTNGEYKYLTDGSGDMDREFVVGTGD
jgi:hypothetical protein